MIDAYLTVMDLFSLSTGGKEAFPVGTFTGPKGRIIHLNVLEQVSSLGMVELRPELGPRGGHCHLRKTECFYLVSGRVRGQYWLEGSDPDQKEIDHTAGHLIMIQPNLFHLFTPLEPSWAVEFSAFPPDLSDAAPAQQLPA